MPRRPGGFRDRTAGMPRRALRAGFTLVELMVAMMIFAIGLLAMVSTSAVVVRQMGDAKQMGLAATVAQNRVEQLYGGICKTGSSGTATTSGVTESWTVTSATRSALLSVTVTYATRRGPRSKTYQSTVACT